MKDIDFDELDRAVNSLMGTIPKDKPAADNDTPAMPNTVPSDASTTTLHPTGADSKETVAPENTMAESDLSAPAEASSAEEPKKAEPVTPQRRGRFMDMVRSGHADSANRPSLSTAARHRSVTLQPSVPERPEATNPTSPDEESSHEMTTAKTENLDALQTVSTQEREDTTSMAASFSSPAPDAIVETEAASVSTASEEAAPLSSPFLADAKVEKRPLGRPADPEITAPSDPENTSKDATVQSLTVAEDTQLPEQPLPAELDSKLLNIERDTSTFDQSTASPTEVIGSETEPSQPPAASPAPAPVVTDTARAMAATSIPQQYKLETTGAHQESPMGGIYDSQPLAHPAPSKPGWIWVVAIIAILVLGALGGAAVYYLGLI